MNILDTSLQRDGVSDDTRRQVIEHLEWEYSNYQKEIVLENVIDALPIWYKRCVKEEIFGIFRSIGIFSEIEELVQSEFVSILVVSSFFLPSY